MSAKMKNEVTHLRRLVGAYAVCTAGETCILSGQHYPAEQGAQAEARATQQQVVHGYQSTALMHR
jgi:hypothetical protein